MFKSMCAVVNSIGGVQEMNTFRTLSHDNVYILDQSLVLGSINGDISGWNVWVDEHVRLGKKMYILPDSGRFCVISCLLIFF